MTFLAAIDEQMCRDPLGATWTDGSLHRSTRDLVSISTGVSWPIVTPGCPSDAEATAALDDRGDGVVGVRQFLATIQKAHPDVVNERREEQVGERTIPRVVGQRSPFRPPAG